MSLMNTTHGLRDEATLARTVGFEDRPNEFVVWVEWRTAACHGGCPVCADASNPQPIGGAVLIRRDAHVILKRSEAEVAAVLGAMASPASSDVTVGVSGVSGDGATGGLS